MLVALAAFLQLAGEARATVLRWETTEVSIDAAPLAESVEASFAFTNTTAEPVTIADVHSSCGCTVPELAKRTYAPGESGSIRVVFTLGDRIGTQEKPIQVTTASPSASTTVLMLRVQIPKLFEVSPYFVVWNRGDPATAKTIELRLLRPDILSLGSVQSRHAVFSAEAAPAQESPERIAITITPSSTEKPLNGAILVNLKTATGDARAVTLYALIRGTPAARPRREAAASTR